MKSIQRKGLTLVSASAFYKNDTAGGVGVHYPDPPKDFISTIDNLLMVWDANATPKRIQEQLTEIGKFIGEGGQLQDNLAMAAFVNIVWLETRGHLIPDNYNGGYWQWTPEKQK